MASLALFDFDGTLTDRDTMLAYCRQVVGTPRFIAGLVWLSPMLALYAVKMVANDRAKVILLRHFLGGRSRQDLLDASTRFADAIDGWLRPGAMDRVAWHRAEGHEVCVVSASLDLWLAPWAARHGLRLLSTQGAWNEESFDGGLSSPNCHGAEKVRRVQEVFDISMFERIYAYGDSSGDREMLALSHEPSYRPFR